MNYTIVIPTLVAFAISAALGPVMIPFLRRVKAGQTVRDEGPKSHLKKTGTPTMGGIIILLAMTLTTLFYIKDYPKVLPILFITLGFGLIGFVDDYIKVIKKHNKGLSAKQKFLMQTAVSLVYALYLYFAFGQTKTLIPFFGIELDLGLFYIPFVMLVLMIMFMKHCFWNSADEIRRILEQALL